MTCHGAGYSSMVPNGAEWCRVVQVEMACCRIVKDGVEWWRILQDAAGWDCTRQCMMVQNVVAFCHMAHDWTGLW